ncbi:kinase-like domain-containing protein [Gilbertella persicaria]|uniref:kinase-like domain-containing protein n=1 Tax=Gilbertella persicaria TaxID=101096 RepID=UPI00221EE76B|nr:kinase-like domain-containing protein [Gilbertella persicaria]KAI8047154.1 kinase-like domain-containing protein [Gilbertella persicaria]
MSRNRNHPDHKLEQQILQTDLGHKVTSEILKYIQTHGAAFDFCFLERFSNQQSMLDSMVMMYDTFKALYKQNNTPFDYHWHWIIPWRQALCFESIIELTNDDMKCLLDSFHPKCHKALKAVFACGLERYMRWYPWRWFSDLVFLGAGGFSAVYRAQVYLPYDAPDHCLFGSQPRTVVLKLVDEKILNEIVVQSKAFVALLFHGMTVCQTTGDLMMILTPANNLNQQIQNTCKTQFHTIAHIVARLALNLANLHDEIGMCHRNIHAENVLCSEDDYVLVDFRFSTSTHEASDVLTASQVHYGRIPYIAPEVQHGIYTEKSDVYSLGIIMWQLISGVLFPSPERIEQSPEQYRIEPIPGIPSAYQMICLACLEPVPEHRPTAEEIGSLLRKMATVNTPLDPSWLDYVKRRQTTWDTSMTASRVYTLDAFVTTSELLLKDIKFQHKRFDVDAVAFQIEMNKDEL